MAQTFRLNSTAATFPLVSTFFGRSTMTRAAIDSNYVTTNSYTGTQADRDIGIPMPIYMHNVLPTSQGLASVGYTQVMPGADLEFSDVLQVRAPDGTKSFIGVTNSGLALAVPTGWTVVVPTTEPLKKVTAVDFRSGSYLFVPRQGLFHWDGFNLNAIYMNGLEPALLEGIVALNNYLVAYTRDTFYFSNATSPSDFVPSLASTAGSIMPLAASGDIVVCLPTVAGFVAYTKRNAIAVKYSGDPRFPLAMTEVTSSGGITDKNHVAPAHNSPQSYYWSNQGCQIIQEVQSELVFPEVTDFLSGRLFEDYIGETGKVNNSNTSGHWAAELQSTPSFPLGENNLVQYEANGEFTKKFTLVGNRYLLLSYGLGPEMHWVLVYDIALKRWGKLRSPHIAIINLGNELEANHTIGFVSKDGKVYQLQMDSKAPAEDSVLIFGRLQHTRGKAICIKSFELEAPHQAGVALSILTSQDGLNWFPGQPEFATITTRNLSKWKMRKTGMNHCVKITGTFDISTLQGSCDIGGER